MARSLFCFHDITAVFAMELQKKMKRLQIRTEGIIIVLGGEHMSDFFHYYYDRLWIDHNFSPDPHKETLYMHAHDMLEIFYFISGDVEFSVEGNIYKLEPDDIIIIRSAEVHCIKTNPGVPYERVTIHMYPTYFSKFCPEYKELLAPFFQRRVGIYNQYRGSQFASNHWKECLNAILTSSKESFNERLYIDANLLSFLVELNLAYSKRDLSEEKTEINELSLKIINYINNNLFTPISVHSISEKFHVSEAHLNRIFNKATGSPVWKYIRVKRLIAAREQICAGVPAMDACMSCGFGDYSAFFRAYKAMFSSTPQEDFRKTKML